MAKNVVKSHFSFARNIILVENIAFRSSPLLVAAKRYATAKKTTDEFNNLMQQMINFIFVELWKNYIED